MTQPSHPSPRGFVFWATAPLLVVFIATMPLVVLRRDLGAMMALGLVEVVAVCVLLGLFNSKRFWWAWRGVGLVVFLGLSANFVAMVVQGGWGLQNFRGRGDASAILALVGLLVIGLPGLWYALFGRLTFRRPPDFEDDWERLWEARQTAIAEVLGPAGDGVYHSPVPFEAGGGADVLVFSGPEGRLMYVTSDLIGSELSLPNENGQYELMICVPKESPWAASLISNLARYTTEAVLSHGETMDIAPALPQPTELAAFVFQTYGTMAVEEAPASLLLCLGITADELALAREQGAAALVEKLKEAGVHPTTDLERRSVLG